jgi:hypothetical protein
MDIDSIDMAARTRSIISLYQCYVAVNITQALGVGDGPAAIPVINDLLYDGTLRSDSPSSPRTI